MIIHSKSKVNKAGEILKDRTAYDEIKVWQAEDVFQYLENRCSHSNVYLPSKGHRDFKELTRCVQWMVEREDLKPGQTLVFFEGTSILEEVKK